MVARAPRPSRLVQSIARWAITLGAAGTLLGATAMYRVLFDKEQVAGKHSLLVLSAILLSLAFVLAPLVRRTFGLGIKPPKPPVPRTLLDEMRTTPEVEGQPALASPQTVTETMPGAPPAPEPPAIASFTARLVTVVYVLFAAMLLAIMWALQNN